jgi:hypothetical protein
MVKKFGATPLSGFNVWNHKLHIKLFLKWCVGLTVFTDHALMQPA